MSQLENVIRLLTQSKHQVFILGDLKIDFLKEGSHSKTEDYLDMLWYSSNLQAIPQLLFGPYFHAQTRLPNKAYLAL